MLYSQPPGSAAPNPASGLPAHHFPQPPEGKNFNWFSWAMQAWASVRTLFWHWALRPDSCTALIAGMIRATSTPMMAITTKSSTRVNPKGTSALRRPVPEKNVFMRRYLKPRGILARWPGPHFSHVRQLWEVHCCKKGGKCGLASPHRIITLLVRASNEGFFAILAKRAAARPICWFILTRSASEGIGCSPRLRFGLVSFWPRPGRSLALFTPSERQQLLIRRS